MQATKQMVESGDWVHIRFQDEPRNKKPVGIYWLQAAAVRLMDQNLAVAWPYRLPSVLAAWFAVLLTYRCGQRLFGPAAGLAAGAVLATSFIVVVEAHIAKTDAALLAATTLCLTMLGELYTRPRDTAPPLGPALLFWLGLGAGILIKGPVIVLVTGATIIALVIADRDFRALRGLRPLVGLPLLLVVVLPWFVAVSSGGQGGFLVDSLRQDLLPKLVGGQESHGAPPGAHLVAALLTAWPWSVLAPFAVIAAWRARAEGPVRLCLAWLIPAWIVFELVPTKLPHYTLPLFPALALMIGWAMSVWSTSLDFLRSISTIAGWAFRALWGGVTLALGAAIVFAVMTFGDGSYIGAICAAAAAALASGYVLMGLTRRTAKTSAISLLAAAVVLSGALTAGVLPHLRQLAVSPRLAEIVARHGSTTPVALAGFHEPSAVFLLGTRTVLTDIAGAAALILATPGALAIVPADALEALTAAVTAGGRKLAQFEAVDGYNYSRGQWLHLAVVTAADTPAKATP